MIETTNKIVKKLTVIFAKHIIIFSMKGIMKVQKAIVIKEGK